MSSKALAFCLLLAAVGASAAADAEKSETEIHALIDEEKRDLEQLEKKIEKQNQKIAAAGKTEGSLLKTLEQIEDRMRLKERERELYRWNAEINKKNTVRLEESIARAEAVLGRQKKELGKWLRALYKEGELYPVKVVFSSGHLTDLLQRVRYMELVVNYDASLFQTYDRKLRQLNQEKESLLKGRAELLQLQKDAEAKSGEIKLERENKLAFLRQIKDEKSLGMRMQKELAAASNNLNGIIARQEEKLRKGENLKLEDHKGRLRPPAEGEILNTFGTKRDKRYESYVIYNGVHIHAPKNTPVRSIFPGEVVYAGPLEGYGNLVIVGHGEKYHSVYAHLDRILTEVGKPVGRDQIIARTGDSGSLIGEALYFELRREGKAIDPAEWMRLPAGSGKARVAQKAAAPEKGKRVAKQ